MGAHSSAVYLESIANILKKPVSYFGGALVRASTIEGHLEQKWDAVLLMQLTD